MLTPPLVENISLPVVNISFVQLMQPLDNLMYIQWKYERYCVFKILHGYVFMISI